MGSTVRPYSSYLGKIWSSTCINLCSQSGNAIFAFHANQNTPIPLNTTIHIPVSVDTNIFLLKTDSIHIDRNPTGASNISSTLSPRISPAVSASAFGLSA